MPVWGGKRDTDCVAESSLLEFLHQENPSLKNKASTLRPPISYTHTITRTRDGMCTGRVAVCPSYAPLTPLLPQLCAICVTEFPLFSSSRWCVVWCWCDVMQAGTIRRHILLDISRRSQALCSYMDHPTTELQGAMRVTELYSKALHGKESSTTTGTQLRRSYTMPYSSMYHGASAHAPVHNRLGPGTEVVRRLL